jgi:hypothetical protein
MTYDEILQLVAEVVGEKLTEKELDALAQAITITCEGIMETLSANGIIAWMATAERITENEGCLLAEIVRLQRGMIDKEDESDEGVRAN